MQNVKCLSKGHPNSKFHFLALSSWETELLRFPAWRQQLDGRPIGFVQIINPLLEDSHYWVEYRQISAP
jgi:hypothetical protein